MPLDMSDIRAELKKDPPGWRPAPQPARWPELIFPLFFFAVLLVCAASFFYLITIACQFLHPFV